MYKLRHAFFIVLSIVLGVVRAPALVYAIVSGGIVFCVTWLLRLPYLALGFIGYKFSHAATLLLLTVFWTIIYYTWTYTEQTVNKYVSNTSYIIALPALTTIYKSSTAGSVDSLIRNVIYTMNPRTLIAPYRKVNSSESPVGTIRSLFGFNHKMELIKKDEKYSDKWLVEKWRKEHNEKKSFWFMIWLFFLASDLSIPFYYLIHEMFSHVDDR